MKNNIMMIYNDEILFVNENEIYDYEKVINKEDLSVSTIIENYDESILKELNQTPKLCLAIVKANGFALEFVEEQTEEICMEAVKQCADVLDYVENQTYDICMRAVSKKPLSLEYVKNQTPEICLEAVKRNINSVMKIKSPKTRNTVLTKLKPVFFHKSIKKYGQYVVDDLIDKYKEYDSLKPLNEEMMNIIKMDVNDMFNKYPDIEKIYYANCNDIITFDSNKIHKILVTYYNNRIDHINKNIKIQEDNKRKKELNDWFKDIIMY